MARERKYYTFAQYLKQRNKIMVKKLLLMMVAVATMVACGGDNGLAGSPDNILLDRSTVVVAAQGGDESVRVDANGLWTATVDVEDQTWISVNPEQSTSEVGELIITTKPNDSGEVREGNVRVISGDAIRAITVSQQKDVEIQAIAGAWSITECDSPAMIGSEFTFNTDNTCLAKITMGGGQELSGTYEVVGNVITVTVQAGPTPMTIQIAIQEMSATEMDCTVMGQFAAKLVKI